MSTVIKPLDPDVQDLLDNVLRSTYLDGQCYEMAIALHRGLNWQMIGLVQTMYGQSVIRHAAVSHPDHGYFDGRGWVNEQDFLKPFGEGQIITFELETDLKLRTRPIQEHAIMMAGKLAMSRWPELPWISDTYFKKIVSFLNDLEKLSRKHGFWLCGGTATSWPMVVTGENDEIGYALATTGNGSYTANRFLKVEQDVETHAARLRTLGLSDDDVQNKVVQAIPIKAKVWWADPGEDVALLLENGSHFLPSDSTMIYKAENGDYAITYEDGYKSVCPKAEFESKKDGLPPLSKT